MTLTMRPTGLGHGVYKDAVDYAVFSGDWNIGRIYERRGFSDAVRFFWSLHGVVASAAPRKSGSIADWRASGQGLAALRDSGPTDDRIGS